MSSFFWALRKSVHSLLGDTCKKCGGEVDLDINHVKNDGTAVRRLWGLSGHPSSWDAFGALGYFTDMIYGILKGLDEVELLCRECHKKFHQKYGYEEM